MLFNLWLRKNTLWITRLWCAGILCSHSDLERFRFTCLYCRWRRQNSGKWTVPPYWIDYTLPWKIAQYVFVNNERKVVGYRLMWLTIKIDPRGHFTMLRCMAIVALDKIMQRVHRLEKPLLEFCEFLANYPTW